MHQWSGDLCIGNLEVDCQHKALFSIAQKVDNIIKDCNSHPYKKNDMERKHRTLIELLKYLKSYAIKHFETEEQFQRDIQYKGYWEHKKIHENFAVKIDQMEQKIFERNCNGECVEDFLDWFSDWLYNHIMREDQKLIDDKKL